MLVPRALSRGKALIDLGGSKDGHENVNFPGDDGIGFICGITTNSSEPSKRLHHEEAFEGTGVGLAIVHRIIRRSGGRVWAEGKVGENAFFYFTLPRKWTVGLSIPYHEDDHFCLSWKSIPSRNFSASDMSPMSRRSGKGSFLINVGVAMICSTRANLGFSAISMISSL